MDSLTGSNTTYMGDGQMIIYFIGLYLVVVGCLSPWVPVVGSMLIALIPTLYLACSYFDEEAKHHNEYK